jgi:hypothetical protein
LLNNQDLKSVLLLFVEEFPFQQFADQVGYHAGGDGRRHTTKKEGGD